MFPAASTVLGSSDLCLFLTSFLNDTDSLSFLRCNKYLQRAVKPKYQMKAYVDVKRISWLGNVVIRRVRVYDNDDVKELERMLSVREVEIAESMDEPLCRLPSFLTSLSYAHDSLYDHPLPSSLPSSLTSLSLNHAFEYNHQVPNPLPSSLISLTVDESFNQPLPS